MSDELMKSIRESEIGKSKCVNCNSTWSSHGGIRCMSDRAKGDRTYQPKGFYPSSVCDNCGLTMHDHYKRIGCLTRGKPNGKVFTVCREMFTDKEFLL